MKQKASARQRREAEALRRKEAFSPTWAEPAAGAPAGAAVPAPVRRKPPAGILPEVSPEEETREFLAYLDRYGVPSEKDEPPRAAKAGGKTAGIPRLNLEEGMPVVSDAVSRLRGGLQEMRFRRAKAVKLIHGYGSTGRGGKIRPAVREELAAMKRRNLIRDYIPGEDFGPVDAASRKLAETDRTVTRDPDYGRMNHGITVVVL